MSIWSQWHVAAVLVLSLFSQAQADDLIGVQYVSCYDGDTCTVTLPHLPPVFGTHLPIRLRGIDAPEMHGRCREERFKSIQARDYLRARMQAAKSLNLKDVTRDKYFRVDAVVIADGMDLNQEMLAKGLARPYSGDTRQSWCGRSVR